MSCRGDSTFNIIEVVNSSLGYDYVLPSSQGTAGQVITASSGAQCIWQMEAEAEAEAEAV